MAESLASEPIGIGPPIKTRPGQNNDNTSQVSTNALTR